MPQAVPADFVGTYTTRWPFYTSAFWAGIPWNAGLAISAAPPVGSFKAWRTYDDSVCMWAQIELTAGNYTWTNLDSFMSQISALGVTTLSFTISGTPTFYASAPDQAQQLYNMYGGGGYPASTSPNGMTALANFVTALVTRYNTPGGGWSGYGTYGKRIQEIQTWNEPGYNGYSSVYWWGTAAQMVDVASKIRVAAKAVDSTIVIASPGFDTAQHGLTFLTTTGTLSGVTGASTCDAIVVHNYNVNLPGMQIGDWITTQGNSIVNLGYDEITGDQYGASVGLNPWRNMMKAGGVAGLPLYMGEGGFDYRPTSAALTMFNSQPPAYRAQFWTRMMMLGAAQGFKRWLTYAFDGPFNCNPNNDPNGVPAAMLAISTNVVGKTITDASYVVGGPVSLTFSDSSVYTV